MGPHGRYTICHTNGGSFPWIAIDYGTRVAVHRVEIFNRRGCSGQRTQNVEVVVLNELQTSATSSDLSSSFRICNLIKAANSAFLSLKLGFLCGLQLEEEGAWMAPKLPVISLNSEYDVPQI